MVNQEIIHRFKKDGAKVWANALAFLDCLIIDATNKDYRLNDKIINEVKEYFTEIEDDETVLFVRDTSFFSLRNQGCVITDQKIHIIYDNSDKESYFYINWADVISVKISKGQFLFSLGDDEDECINIEPKMLLKGSNLFICQKRIAEFLNEIASMAIDPIMDAIARIDNENTSEEEGIEIATEMIGQYPEYDGIFEYYIGCRAYDNGEIDKAFELMKNALKCDNISDEARSYANLVLGEIGIKTKYDNISETKAWLWNALCMNCSKDTTIDDKTTVFEQALDCLNKLDEYIISDLSRLPYSVRKILVPIKNYEVLNKEKELYLSVISVESLRASRISFPVGHPMVGQVYVAHPVAPDKYILLDDHALAITEEKIREFCYFVQCMGATKISIKFSNASDKLSATVNTSNKGGGISVNSIDVDIKAEEASDNRMRERLKHLMLFNQEFYPVAKPYIPDDLSWFDQEPSWKQLAKQRMNGSLIRHCEHIEIKKSQVVQCDEMEELSGRCAILFKEARGFLEKYKHILNESINNTSINIEVSFRPLDKNRDYL
ncbi:MAG: hypothetical protein K2K45_02975 [Muribaculaceae bacterium]|nr:hypothetical protein [Muribaculaceae bacterium]